MNIKNLYFKIKMKKNYWNIATIIYLMLYGLVCLLIGKIIKFHVGLNDFWGILFVAENLDISKPESFYNGFFPIGYTIVLKILSFGNPIILAYLTNIFLGLLMLGSIAYLSSVTIGPSWALLSTVILSLLPKIFEYITLPGPDIGTAAFTAIGGTLLIISTIVKFEKRKTIKLIVVGGVLFGLSALWRYHGLVMGFGFILSAAITSGRSLYYILFGFISMLSVYLIQIFFNIFSGHGLFETATNFNIYISVHGVDWYKTSAIVKNIPQSTFEIILNSPKGFLLSYNATITQYLFLVIPSLLIVLVLKETRLVKTSMVIAQASIFYLLVVGMGARFSNRTDILLLPFTIYQIIVISKFVCKIAYNELRNQKLEILSTLFVLIIIGSLQIDSFLREDVLIIKDKRATNQLYQSVEKVLVEQGINNSKQAFTTDMSLYFPNLKPYKPYYNGGWERYSMYGLNQKYPDLSVESIDKFLEDCYIHKITHLVLDPGTSDFLAELGQVYYGELKLKQLTKIADFSDSKSNLKIFRINTSDRIKQ